MFITFPFPGMDLPDISGAYLTMPFELFTCGTQFTSNPTEATDPDFGAFKRLSVSFAYVPFTAGRHAPPRVFWELSNGFVDPGPYNWTLQRSQAGTPRADDWVTCNTGTGVIFFLDDIATDNPLKQQHMFGKTVTQFYRVLLNTPKSCYQSEQITVIGKLNKHDWGLVREFYRKQQLAHEIFSSERGYLLKARRFGARCTCYRDSLVEFLPTDGSDDYTKKTWITDEIIDTQCPLCYGTGIIGGYYAPTESYSLLTQERTREERDMKTGTAKEVKVQGQFLGVLPLIQGDVWISADSDRRYYIHSIIVDSHWKGVVISYIAELRLAPFTDVIYDFPINPSTT